ncbi:polysaccharide synthesis protein GtrA [Thauera terpenica 58Eu]|jgi:putative flippase GtrA|uniref:Polysaccharide synthesis protein GtrA n=1 Tax=Thauera terpenica 58Eu TaxID=1348657 RepID=T0AYZ0_9RHOO|nr:GtrA family protein [Thauera terpenica]EPZ15823.1 polysaccharide synthesis protein GtrA [Thauera terpenica 58Eu]
MSADATVGQFIRYATVGLGSNIVLYLAYLALTAAGIESKLAMSLLYVLGVVQTFAFNKRWSFRHGGLRGPTFVRYCVSYALGYLINLGALLILVDRLGYPHQAVQGVMILTLAVLLFLLQKFWVFRPSVASSHTTGLHP